MPDSQAGIRPAGARSGKVAAGMMDFLQQLHPAWLALIRVLLFVVPLLLVVPGLIWWERRLLAWMQDRIGPNRVATITWPKDARWVPPFLRGKKTRLFGLLQPIADGIKLFLKEDITPAAIDRAVYFVAPAIALFPAFALGGTLPWAPPEGVYGLLTPIADVNIGVLYLMAVSSLGAYGIILSGYASNNKYSLLGGLRASAQLISYELAMGMSIAAVVLATGSLKMTDMIKAQTEPLWGVAPLFDNWNVLTPMGFVAAVVFLICMVAETNRAPFDLPEAENELIAGYHTEYSSMKFASFFMGEYAAMFVFSGVFATLFLGGPNMVPVDWVALGQTVPALEGFGRHMASVNYWASPLTFVGKCAFGITLFIWMRATLPRLRYDQLMALGWRSLLPLAVANFLIVALYLLCTDLYGAGGGWIAVGAAFALLAAFFASLARAGRGRREALPRREIRLVDPAKPKEGAAL